MNTGKDYGLPEGYEDWVEAQPPLGGNRWVSVEVRVGGIGSASIVLSRKWFIPPRPKPALPNVGPGAVLSYTNTCGERMRVMRLPNGRWVDDTGHGWPDVDVLHDVDENGFTVELEGL